MPTYTQAELDRDQPELDREYRRMMAASIGPIEDEDWIDDDEDWLEGELATA